MLAAITIFGLSLFCILLLFVFKAWELRTSRVVARGMRARADEGAMEFKRWLSWSQEELKKLPPEIVFLTRTILHDAALGAASVARFLERQSHKLADIVSHKRGFERRETQSDFLRHVSDYKSDATDSDNVSL